MVCIYWEVENDFLTPRLFFSGPTDISTDGLHSLSLQSNESSRKQSVVGENEEHQVGEIRKNRLIESEAYNWEAHPVRLLSSPVLLMGEQTRYCFLGNILSNIFIIIIIYYLYFLVACGRQLLRCRCASVWLEMKRTRTIITSRFVIEPF